MHLHCGCGETFGVNGKESEGVGNDEERNTINFG